MCISNSLKPFIYIAVLLLFSACSNEQHDKHTIASSPWPGYEPLYLGRDHGTFDNKGITLFELPSSDITMESFRNHSADLASLTLDETLELIDEGIKLRILLIMDISNGGDAVLAKSSIKKLSDIKGKRISIVNIPLGSYLLNRLLDIAGVERKDVEVYPMPETHQEEFYKKGKADLVITFDPIKSRLEKQGMHVLFDSSDIPNEIFDMLVVHEDIYKYHFDEMCEIGKNWFKTLEYIKNNKQEASEYMGKRLGVDAATFDNMMKGLIVPDLEENKRLLSGESPKLLEPAKMLASIMLKEKQLSKFVDASVAVDKHYMECVAK